MFVESFSVQLSLPPAEISQNAASPGSWRRKAKAIKCYRAVAKLMCQSAGVPASCPWRAATISVFFYYPDKRRRDLLNTLGACKPGIDGIVDAGVLTDDDKIKLGKVDSEIDAADPRVLVFLERLE